MSALYNAEIYNSMVMYILFHAYSHLREQLSSGVKKSTDTVLLQ